MDAESITYAKETLLSGTANVQEVEDDATTYYKLTRDHFVSAAPGVTGEADDLYILTYDLSGMVFAGDEMVATPLLLAPSVMLRAACLAMITWCFARGSGY